MKFNEFVEGVFIEESKNRFLCTVMIENEICECYVPSSSRIENYLKLRGRKVLLTINNKPESRTNYSLFAVEFYNKYILLNLNIINKVVESIITNGRIKLLDNYQIRREQTFNGYKADLLLSKNENIALVEIKGIIASRRIVSFPTVYSERAVNQLTKIKELLQSGIKVFYVITSLSPIVKKIELNSYYTEYKKLLYECMELGMEIRAFSLKFEENEIKFNKKILIIK
ncbi:DNA/RNA nuclease SfsA [Peribacillus muralis]|uniref:DNA/RNA nuclease SfsA n=1 Tax=Peribacillus muralis TaxID=264697 RepID=UPI001F4EE8ED|nr:DNA/RNA nuclease SfsA [Peribacillus muralis]MCK1994909.1 DNA/RNA nuclease SfsA [Peribacillus muralis]MCK2015545.1 DNA/RNA nuclease SfsA [Peribacillus muralis]